MSHISRTRRRRSAPMRHGRLRRSHYLGPLKRSRGWHRSARLCGEEDANGTTLWLGHCRHWRELRLVVTSRLCCREICCGRPRLIPNSIGTARKHDNRSQRCDRTNQSSVFHNNHRWFPDLIRVSPHRVVRSAPTGVAYPPATRPVPCLRRQDGRDNERQTADLTSIFFFCSTALAVFGIVTVSTPLEKSAAILSRSTPSGT